jgi:hypothetical protein
MWFYEDKEVSELSDIPNDTFGFIYRIIHIPTQKEYIGKKQLISNRTLPPLKGTKRKRKIQKESDWKTYYGSHSTIKQMIKDGKADEFRREIIEFATSKKQLTYLETRYLFQYRVLEFPDLFYNDNILNRFFRTDFFKSNKEIIEN